MFSARPWSAGTSPSSTRTGSRIGNRRMPRPLSTPRSRGREVASMASSPRTTAPPGGAVQALLEEGLACKVLVTGQDAELVACQRIARGTQSMSVYKPIKALATRAAQAAVAFAQGKPVVAGTEKFNGKINVPTIAIDVVLVTRGEPARHRRSRGFPQRKRNFRRGRGQLAATEP